jgi:putative tryptophan/tyrosine transport system substrate-binding protein
MRRREFITFIGSAIAGVVPATAQDSVAPFRIAILGSGSATDNLSLNEVKWLREGLKAEGLVEGQHFVIDARYAGGDYSRFKELTRDQLARQPGAIAVSTIAAAKAAQELTTTVPIVMLGLNDPIGTGLVFNLAKPGGNITGIASMNEDLQLKLLQMLREALPKASRVAVLVNPRNPSSFGMIAAVRSEAVSAGIAIEAIEVATPDALDPAFEQLARNRPDVLFVIPDISLAALSARIVAAAAVHRVPTVGTFEELTEAGALMSYGRVRQETIHRAASYIKRIAHGAKPGDLPVEQPTRFRLIINLKAANAFGIPIPLTLLARADEVIE